MGEVALPEDDLEVAPDCENELPTLEVSDTPEVQLHETVGRVIMGKVQMDPPTLEAPDTTQDDR